MFYAADVTTLAGDAPLSATTAAVAAVALVDVRS